MWLLVSRTAVALLSMFLCVRQALAGFHFFVTPIQVPLSPGSTEMVSKLGEGLGISDPIHHLVTELCFLRPLF